MSIAAGPRNVFMGRDETLMRSASGGARRDRTDDLMLAKHALYQLSYGPFGEGSGELSATVTQPGRAGRPGQTRTADLTLIRRTL